MSSSSKSSARATPEKAAASTAATARTLMNRRRMPGPLVEPRRVAAGLRSREWFPNPPSGGYGAARSTCSTRCTSQDPPFARTSSCSPRSHVSRRRVSARPTACRFRQHGCGRRSARDTRTPSSSCGADVSRPRSFGRWSPRTGERCRVLKPGGHFLFATLGEHYLGLGRLNASERHDFEQGNPVVLYEESPGTSLCSAYHPPEYVRRTLASDFEFVSFRPAIDY